MNSTACGFAMGFVWCPISVTVRLQKPVLLQGSSPLSGSRLRMLQENSQVAHLLEVPYELPQMLEAGERRTWHLAWNLLDREYDVGTIPTQVKAHTDNPSENCSICWSQFSWYVLKLNWGITWDQLSTNCTKMVLKNFNHFVNLSARKYPKEIFFFRNVIVLPSSCNAFHLTEKRSWQPGRSCFSKKSALPVYRMSSTWMRITESFVLPKHGWTSQNSCWICSSK